MEKVHISDEFTAKTAQGSARRAAAFSGAEGIEITIAPNAGACFGVVRAIKLGQQAVDRAPQRRAKEVYSFGPLVHNPKTIDDFKRQGVEIVEKPSQIEQGTVILRSHGVRREIEADLKSRGIQIVDATCPLVKKPQKIAQSLAAKGYFLVLVGDPNHPEVKGVLSYFGSERFLVTYKPEDVAMIPSCEKRIGILAQTTIEVGVLEAVVALCKARFQDVAVYNTICDATSIRQTEAEVLAKGADVVVVVGGRNSSNTSKLVKICKAFQSDTHLIENMSELDPAWFVGKTKIGVTGGASTPQDYVDAVGEQIALLVQQHSTTIHSLH